MTMMKERAVFLDRDGVINRMVYYAEHGIVDSPFKAEQFFIFPEAAKAIRLIHKMGMQAILVSNQPGIAKGFYPLKNFTALNRKMRSILKGPASLDGIYYCLHHPQAKIKKYRRLCNCRKPRPGLLLSAAREKGIDLPRSYMIGDGVVDIEAGSKAGCRTILIGKPKCDMCRILADKGLEPDAIAENLWEAVCKIKKWEVA